MHTNIRQYISTETFTKAHNCVYIYIYIYRERERDIWIYISVEKYI